MNDIPFGPCSYLEGLCRAGRSSRGPRKERSLNPAAFFWFTQTLGRSDRKLADSRSVDNVATQNMCLDSLRGKRNRAILALLIGCDLRLAELVGLGMEDFQVREEHWVIADLIGNGKHLSTVPVPAWVKGAVDEWTDAATRAWRLETVWSVSWYMGTTTLYCPDRYQTTQPRWRLCGTGPSSKLAR
jgi:integrase